MPDPSRRSLTLSRVLVGALILLVALPLATTLTLALITTDIEALATPLSEARWGLIALGYIGSFAPFALNAWRWRILLPGKTPTIVQTTGFVFVGTAVDNIIPGPVGALVQSYLMHVRRGVGLAEAFASAVLSRLFGLAVMFVVLLALISASYAALPDEVRVTFVRGVVILCAGIVFVAGLAAFPRASKAILGVLAGWLPSRGRRRPGEERGGLVAALQRFGASLIDHTHRIATSPGRIGASLLISAAALLVNAACWNVMLIGMGLTLPYAWVALLFCLQVFGQVSNKNVPGSGVVSGQLLTMAVMTRLLGYEESPVLAAIFVIWASNVVHNGIGLAIIVTNFGHVTRALSIRNPLKSEPGAS